MKYKVTGIERPQYSRIGLIKPDSEIEVSGAAMEAKADKIKYLKKIKKLEEEKCQKNEKPSRLTKKPQTGEQKSRLTKLKESF